MKPLEPGVKPWLASGPLRPRLPGALDDLEALVTELGTARHVDSVVDGVGEVQVQVHILLVVDPGTEPRGAGLIRHDEGNVVLGNVGLSLAHGWFGPSEALTVLYM